MYTLEISDESLKKLEKIGKEFSGMDNKIVKEALRKALNYAKKEEKKFIKSRYSLQQKVDANSLKSKITSIIHTRNLRSGTRKQLSHWIILSQTSQQDLMRLMNMND